MAEQGEDGYWRQDNDTSSGRFTTREQADAQQYRNVHGSGGGATNGLVGIFIMIFLFGPIVFSKLVGWLFGLLFKLGIVGKIIQTAFIALIVGPIIAFYVVSLTGAGKVMPSFLQTAFLLAFILLPAAWYFLWHYDTVKNIDASTFSGLVKNLACFIWFGGIGAVVIGLMKGSEGITSVIGCGAIIAGLVCYGFKIRPYTKDAAPGNIPAALKPVIMLIAFGAVVGLTVVDAGARAVKEAASWAAFEKDHDDIFQAAKTAGSRRATVVVSNIFRSGSGTPIFADAAHGLDNVVTWVQKDDILTITGEVLAVKKVKGVPSGWWKYIVPVEYEGSKGFISLDYIALQN